jgi:hypothetical protein
MPFTGAALRLRGSLARRERQRLIMGSPENFSLHPDFSIDARFSVTLSFAPSLLRSWRWLMSTQLVHAIARVVFPSLLLCIATTFALAECTHRTRVPAMNCDDPWCSCDDLDYEDCLSVTSGWTRYANATTLYDCDAAGTIHTNIYAEGITTCGNILVSPDACVWLTEPNERCVCGDNQNQWSSTGFFGGPMPTCVGGCGDPDDFIMRRW